MTIFIGILCVVLAVGLIWFTRFILEVRKEDAAKRAFWELNRQQAQALARFFQASEAGDEAAATSAWIDVELCEMEIERRIQASDWGKIEAEMKAKTLLQGPMS
jgi:type II secretory pathway pseudopilin PulG